MTTTEIVRISVPYGSPSRTASRAAWRPTDSAEPRMATNSQAKIPTRYCAGFCDKRASKALPNAPCRKRGACQHHHEVILRASRQEPDRRTDT